VQAALEFLWGNEEGVDDTVLCQNHMIKGTYEMIEASCPRLKENLDALQELFAMAASSGTVIQILKAYRYLHDIAATAFYISNETRWEGHQKTIECAVKQEKDLPVLLDAAKTLKKCSHVRDFLVPSFFARLKVYAATVEHLNRPSLLFQSKSFPTGHLVPLVYKFLEKQFAPVLGDDDLPPWHADLKRCVSNAVTEKLAGSLFSNVSPFLKSAMYVSSKDSLQHAGL
jgi:hypothetical protein